MLTREDIQAMMPDEQATSAAANEFFNIHKDNVDAEVRLAARHGLWNVAIHMPEIPEPLVDLVKSAFAVYFEGCTVSLTRDSFRTWQLYIDWSG